jgi:hypothetical protein
VQAKINQEIKYPVRLRRGSLLQNCNVSVILLSVFRCYDEIINTTETNMKDLIQQLQFSEDELFSILRCANLKDFNEQFAKSKKEVLLLEWLNQARCLHELDRSTDIFMDATKYSTYPLTSYFAFASAVSLGACAVPLSITALVLTAVVGLGYFLSAKNTAEKETETRMEFLQLSEIKLQAASELSFRCHGSFSRSTPAQLGIAAKQKAEAQIKFFPSVRAGATVCATLGLSHFWGVSLLLKAIGFAVAGAAMTSPLGIAIATAAVVAIGIYFAHKYYQASKSSEFVNQYQTAIDDEVKVKTGLCNGWYGKNAVA